MVDWSPLAVGGIGSICRHHINRRGGDAECRCGISALVDRRHNFGWGSGLHPNRLANSQATKGVGVFAVIFETLNEAAERGELLLVNGGLCHWHLRLDGQITIREIIVLPHLRRRGIGTMMLEKLKAIEGAICIFAKCPCDLPANHWYANHGFMGEGIETTKTGRRLQLWRLRF